MHGLLQVDRVSGSEPKEEGWECVDETPARVKGKGETEARDAPKLGARR